MNREIKFRGKSTLDGKWVFGSYKKFYGYHVSDIHHQIHTYDGANIYEVIPETVGQYTGVKDKNGKEIYEGEIIRFIEENCLVNFVENDCAFRVDVDTRISTALRKVHSKDYEVIGNIYDNFELLEVSI